MYAHAGHGMGGVGTFGDAARFFGTSTKGASRSKHATFFVVTDLPIAAVIPMAMTVPAKTTTVTTFP